MNEKGNSQVTDMHGNAFRCMWSGIGKKIMESDMSKIHSMTLSIQWIFRKCVFIK